jgi:ferrous iron transport protein B
MAVVAIIAAAFFGNQAIFVTIGIILFSLLILVLVGLVMNKFVIRGSSSSLMMELPLYHLPNPRLIWMVTWQSLKAFIKRAGTIILIVSVVIWALSFFPSGDIGSSFLAQFGKWLEPAGKLMGMGWQTIVALLTSFIAKENTIATLGVLTGGQGTGLAVQLQNLMTPAAAIAFLVIQVLFIPCVATLSAVKTETNSWRWPAFIVTYQLILSFGLAIAVYQIARLIM